MMAATAGSVVGRAIEPGEADAFHFCGHIFTTGSCPHPTGTPRIDKDGFPLHAGRRRAGRQPRPPGERRRLAGRQERQGAARPGRPAAAARARARASATRPRASTTSRPGSTAAGIAAAAGGCASSSTAARTRTGGSTATPRSPATATAAARSSASCTSRRRSRADGLRLRRDHPARRRGAGRRDRDLVAMRVLDDRDDRPDRPHRRALGHPGRLRDLPARRGGRRRDHVRRPGAARLGAAGRLARVRDRGRDRGRGGGRRGARIADRAADPPPAPRALAPGDADAAGGGALRRPARARASRPSS